MARAPLRFIPRWRGASLGSADGDQGVVVQTVAEGSPAAQSGLRPNDLILAVGRVRVTNVEQLRNAVRGVNAFAITISRGNSTLVFPDRMILGSPLTKRVRQALHRRPPVPASSASASLRISA